jgi:soluble lytic murein transglycosylase-like protein
MILTLYSLFVLKQKPIISLYCKPKPIVKQLSTDPKPVVNTEQPQETQNFVSIPQNNNTNYDGLLQKYFGSAWQQAEVVANCESGMDPNNYNPSGASGLFQILVQAHQDKIAGRNIFDPEVNVEVASELYQEQGWAPWESSRSCWDK